MMQEELELSRYPGPKSMKLDCFWLKILGLFFMTLDHIGLAMNGPEGSPLYWASFVLRIFGRLAFPIFALLLAEGLKHTHSRGLYMLRISIMWGSIMVVQAILIFCFGFDGLQEQAFSDLIGMGMFIYLLEHRKKWLRPFCIIPFAYLAASYAIRIYSNYTVAVSDFLFLFGGYSMLGFFIFLGFYYSEKIVRWSFSLNSAFDDKAILDEYAKSGAFRFYSNLMGVFLMIVSCTIFYAIALCTQNSEGISLADPSGMGTQFYCVFSGLLIACYNGKRGYNAKWFQYGSYLYYPLHLLVIFGIAYLVA